MGATLRAAKKEAETCLLPEVADEGTTPGDAPEALSSQAYKVKLQKHQSSNRGYIATHFRLFRAINTVVVDGCEG